MAKSGNIDRGWRRELVVSEHFEGPTDLVLGAHISGLMAPHLDSDTVEVSMRKPTLIGRSLILDAQTPDRVFLYDGEMLLNVGDTRL